MRKLLELSLAITLLLSSCVKQDLDDIRKDVSDLKSRVEKLEVWCNTTNSQISALQELVAALDAKDYVTDVIPIMEGAKEIGYTITFTKSKPISIMHGTKGDTGEQGAAGKDGITPIIGVKQHTDDHYYWTVKIGTADATWMLDAGGNKIRTTGEDGNDGHTPVLSVAEFEGRLYWQIDSEWMLQDGQKIPATGDKGETGAQGPQGDAIFAEDGIDYQSDPDNVIFTLADGVTTITLPRTSMVTVGFDSYEVFMGSTTQNEITLVFPSTLKEADYTAITATVTNESGTGADIETRAAATDLIWGVEVTKPAFNDGKPVAGSGKVTLTAPKNIELAQTAILKVTIIDKQGKEYTAARPVKHFDGFVVESTAGGLSSVITDPSVTKLAINGSVNADDFSYIKQSLTSLEELDLSMTDLITIPENALFVADDKANQNLRKVIIPQSVRSIDYQAFRSCVALESFNTKNAESIGERAFQSCTNLRDMHLGNKLQTINNNAFRHCRALTSIDIPANVKTLGRWIFNSCEDLETITLHEGLQTLSESTFYECGVISIRIPSTVTEIPGYAFSNCKKLERITMHDGITSIGIEAFFQCYALENVKIPARVTIVPTAAFYACRNLQTVTFHNNITEIQMEAFASCINLTNADPTGDRFELPSSLSTIGDYAFHNCISLAYVDMSQTKVKIIPEYCFSGCKKMNSVQLPANLTNISSWAFNDTNLNGITLPASIQMLGKQAFWQCANLKQFTSKATTPPQISTEVFAPTFDKSFKTNCALYAPKSGLEKDTYSAWKDYFKSIRYNQ